MSKNIREVVKEYQQKIHVHESAIAALKSELQNYLAENIGAVVDCLMETEEKPVEPEMLTIVRVLFKSTATKFYDYEFIKVHPTDTVKIGDTVVVDGFKGPTEVTVVEVFTIRPEDQTIDYKPAFINFDRMCEYDVEEM